MFKNRVISASEKNRFQFQSSLDGVADQIGKIHLVPCFSRLQLHRAAEVQNTEPV